MARPTNDEFDIGMTVADLTDMQKSVIKAKYKKKRISMKILAQAVADGVVSPKPPFDPLNIRYGQRIVLNTTLRGEHTGKFLEYIDEPERDRVVVNYLYEGGHHFAVSDNVVRRA